MIFAGSATISFRQQTLQDLRVAQHHAIAGGHAREHLGVQLRIAIARRVQHLGHIVAEAHAIAQPRLDDAATILVLLFATLFVTTFLVQDTTSTDSSTADRPVAEMPVNPTEKAQYQRLIDSGATDLATVNSAVDASTDQPDKYDINVWALLGTAVLLAVYLGFVYRTSFREYREVVEERFGPTSERESTA